MTQLFFDGLVKQGARGFEPQLIPAPWNMWRQTN
uniref:Uncharacterized protein n=1 Tax=Arundo donax TaxID=35708 RepID=A0A0A9TB79_ARUDO